MIGTLRHVVQRSASLALLASALLLARPAFAQPANDNPCNAIALPVNAACVNTNGTVQNATNSTVAVPSCGNGNSDVWYTVVVPASGNLTVNTAPGASNALTNGGMAFYTVGNCATPASFTQIACNDDQIPLFNQMPLISVTCQTPGTTIYIRLWKQSGGNNSRTFTICATDPGAGPANDNPCGAVPLTVSTACNNTVGNNTSACPTAVANPSCGGYSGGDVWFSFVVPAGGNVTITGSTNGLSALTDGAMAVYSATNCATLASFTQLGCDDNSGPGNMPMLTLAGLTPGQTLYIRFWANGNNAFGAFNLCITSPIANDAPCGSIALPVNTSCSYTSGTNVGATNNSTFPAPGCGNFGTGSLDVWYSFTAPASGTAIIETTAGTMTDGAMALYSANACNGTYTLVQCDDDNGPGLMPYLAFTGLTPGTTYYLRFWGYGTGTGTYNICVHGPATVPAGQCVYVLQLSDSGNDGWGTSQVGISINGGPYTYYTCTGTGDIFLIGVNIGNVIIVNYNASGTNQAQNNYTLALLSGGGQIFNSGSPPTAGIAFTQTVTCTPPPSPQSDCNGGATICSSQSFNNNSSGAGNVADLNASNEGCLATGEHQGTWYRFSPSTGGTIGMTIAPTVTTTDYDFAIWGPLASVQCPPLGTPYRCSYSGLTGNTGLGNGAVDVTEGAGGDKWVSLMNVTAGQIYVLYIDNYSTNGQSFALSWQLTNGASLSCTVLPIALTDFTAEARDKDVLVDWTTATEENNDHFDIERSRDGEVFEKIGAMDGADNSTQTLRYSFGDAAPVQGLSYYRLKQVDFNGASTFSRTAAVVFHGEQGKLTLFPNPGNDQVRVIVPHGGTATELRITDAIGREVMILRPSSADAMIDASRLPRGIYAIRAMSLDGSTLAQGQWIKE